MFAENPSRDLQQLVCDRDVVCECFTMPTLFDELYARDYERIVKIAERCVTVSQPPKDSDNCRR